MAQPVLAMDGLTKRYGEVTAVRSLDLAVAPGEVLALIGENGAGKSTVVNMIAGMTAPDAGVILVGGARAALSSARAARALGIGVVHQHYALVPSFTVAETVALGRVGAGRLDPAALAARVRDISDRAGIVVDPAAQVGSLDVAGQQRVEILKALSQDVRLLLLDEPTTVLTPEDAARLFAMVARLKASGVAVILVTHRLDNVFGVCDRVAVLHAGVKVADLPVARTSPRDLVSLMISGRTGDSGADGLAQRLSSEDLTLHQPAADPPGPAPARVPARAAAAPPPGPVRMGLEGVALHRANGSVAVAGLGFALHGGEILAVAGVDGNGQSELVDAMAGLSRPDRGIIRMGALDSGQEGWNPRALRRAGLAHIPADRRRNGILPGRSLTENLLLSRFFRPAAGRGWLIDRTRAEGEARAAIGAFDIRTTGPAQPVGRLSGGNQQKLVLARELMDDPAVILAAHPSRGLDVRTIAFVQDQLRRHRDRGAAILLVSADLGEIWGLADRVVTLSSGRARGPVAPGDTSREEIGGWMAGH
ncbi:MAG: ATP-binding cassette domain-containing protein [Rhodobacteraceae bacterium]|nr:ATP-binding cassette domain-containing protein [Paracoccaceae bacterium]